VDWYIVCVFSVVQEVVEFFAMGFQFGVPQALFGVRRMLPLIWSKEPGVREAVLNAYRQLYLNPKGDSARYVRFFYLLTF
jgi:condensin complex subunit 1